MFFFSYSAGRVHSAAYFSGVSGAVFEEQRLREQGGGEGEGRGKGREGKGSVTSLFYTIHPCACCVLYRCE